MSTTTKPQKNTRELYQDEKPKPAADPKPATGRLLDDVIERTVAELDDLATATLQQVEEAEGRLKKSVVMAKGIARLRALLSDRLMQDYFMPLMNSKLGFVTDRPNEKHTHPYPVATVRDCLIEALLKGFYPVNNEFNIIAGNFYGAQNGWYRKVCDVAGLTDLDVIPGVPVQHNGQTVVRVVASWKLHGQAQRLSSGDNSPGRTFTIRTNSGSGPDQTLGKALAKAYKAIYRKLTGTENTLDPDDHDEAVAGALAQSRAAQVSEKLGQVGAAPVAPPKPGEDRGTVTKDQLGRLQLLSRQAGLDPANFDGWLARFGAEKAEELSEVKAEELLTSLLAETQARREPGAEG